MPHITDDEMQGWCDTDQVQREEIARLRADAERSYKRIADLERRLGRFLSLYQMFGQDDMTDAKFAAAFERVYLDVSLGEHQDRDQANR